MSKCPMPCIPCDDETCKQYTNHFYCPGHALHIGDLCCRKSDGKTGYVYDANPYGSRRSLIVMWDEPVDGKKGIIVWGHAACIEFEPIPGPRTTKPVSSKT